MQILIWTNCPINIMYLVKNNYKSKKMILLFFTPVIKIPRNSIALALFSKCVSSALTRERSWPHCNLLVAHWPSLPVCLIEYSSCLFFDSFPEGENTQVLATTKHIPDRINGAFFRDSVMFFQLICMNPFGCPVYGTIFHLHLGRTMLNQEHFLLLLWSFLLGKVHFVCPFHQNLPCFQFCPLIPQLISTLNIFYPSD